MKAAALLFAAAFAVQADDPGPYRNRLDRYLLAYEPQLSTVIADEVLTQRTRERQWVVNHRRIESEVAFIALPGGSAWMGFRRVTRVNGKAIADGGVALARLLTESSSDNYGTARRLLAESAAHNLGTARTINLPNLPLELLHPRHRPRFAQHVFGSERVRGTPTVVLRFDEIVTPTIIQQPGGGDTRTVVWAWIEPETGRLLRAQVSTRDMRIGVPPFVAVIRVEFKEDDKVGMLVPAEMTETFYVDRGGEGTGTARYSNYRRFITAARLVPQ